MDMTTSPHSQEVLVPVAASKQFYGKGIPGIDPSDLTGKLIVIEGADGSGRSTQIRRLVDWLESSGHGTVQVGLKRSSLIAEEIEQAKEGNALCNTTLSLFYATDFADQLENTIIPALKAGFMVLADRYIYTPMVRDIVRGLEADWVRNLYGIALIPDAVFYLNVPPEQLIHRSFAKNPALDYWESGMDLGLARDMFDSFLRYQSLVREHFVQLEKDYHFQNIDGTRSEDEVYATLKSQVTAVLEGRNPIPPRESAS